MVDTSNVFFTTVAPSIGIAVATLLFLAPMNKVITVVKTGQLQDLNPLPYPFIVANCAAWALGFAVVTSDPYIFFANVLGLCTGVFYTLGTYPLATFQMRLAIMSVMVLATAALSLVGFLGSWLGLDADGLRALWGWSANVILVLFYLSPLATLWGVLRRRDASSIHWPLALMTVINGLLWVFYGFAMQDAFIWAPNAFGTLVGALNLLLRCLFPARKSRFARIAQPVAPDEAAPPNPMANGAAATVAVGTEPKDLEVALHPVDSEGPPVEVPLGRVDSRAPLREAGNAAEPSVDR